MYQLEEIRRLDLQRLDGLARRLDELDATLRRCFADLTWNIQMAMVVLCGPVLLFFLVLSLLR